MNLRDKGGKIADVFEYLIGIHRIELRVLKRKPAVQICNNIDARDSVCVQANRAGKLPTAAPDVECPPAFEYTRREGRPHAPKPTP